MLVLHDGMKDAVLWEVLESKNRITLLGSGHISFTYLFLVSIWHISSEDKKMQDCLWGKIWAHLLDIGWSVAVRQSILFPHSPGFSVFPPED